MKIKQKTLSSWLLVMSLLSSAVADISVFAEEAVENAVTESTAAESTVSACEAAGIAEDTQITIIYSNDFHSFMANTKTVELEDGTTEEVPALRMSNVSALVKDLRSEGEEVLLVDAGDEIQGSTYGSIDQGETVIKLMNAAGYQLATPGNHEFDYGLFRLFSLTDKADFPYITANLHSLIGEDPFDELMIMEAAGKKIAFIGVTTPEAITSSVPVYFQDESGNFIYDISGAADPQDMYDCVQETIDLIADDVDYIIGLGHVGVGLDEQRNHISSYNLIENTVGLDAFIDGHSHTTLPSEIVKDKEGNDVLLTQTGAGLSAIGVMQISEDGIISSHLVSEYDGVDPNVAAIEEETINYIQETLGQKIAELPATMYTHNPENPQQRLIRSREMNIGDLTADSLYWYFTMENDLSCDFAFNIGGCIRDQIPAGDITMNNLISVEPFGNQICMIEATGQQILDCLELGATVTGEYNLQWDCPAENGGFVHPAGLEYTIDATIPCSVVVDENGMFKSVDGEYRVKNVAVFNRDTGSFEPLELDRIYRVASDNYKLRDGGDGMSMFMNCEMVVDYVGVDCDIFAEYIKSFAGDGEYPVITTENCPLSRLEGYPINYENPEGAGRITIILEDNEDT